MRRLPGVPYEDVYDGVSVRQVSSGKGEPLGWRSYKKPPKPVQARRAVPTAMATKEAATTDSPRRMMLRCSPPYWAAAQARAALESTRMTVERHHQVAAAATGINPREDATPAMYPRPPGCRIQGTR